LAEGYVPPSDAASQRRRLRAAQSLLAAAGWQVREGQLVHTESGRPFAFEILIDRPDNERLALTWARQLQRLGMAVSVRNVDGSQYEARRQSFDFDVIVNFWGNSLSPGNEQYYYWSQAAADTKGSRNYPGVRDPGVDAMIAALTGATTREDFVAAARALDRLLLGGRYVVPLFYAPYDRLAWRRHLERPARPSLYGYRIETWWAAPEGRASVTPRPR
jgi:ABC-type oligopeptide transport system substrate-binding subunit